MKDTRNAVLHYLQRYPLKHIIHLKMLFYHDHLIETTYVAEGSAEGILLLFPTTALSYDHQKYGEYELVAMPVADSPQLLAKLLDHVPNTAVVFKSIKAKNTPSIKLAQRVGLDCFLKVIHYTVG